MNFFRQGFVVPAILLLSISTAWPQQSATQNQSGSQTANDNQDNQSSDEPDEPVASKADKLKADQNQALSTAWEMLQSTSQASKPRDHVSLVVALGTMGGYKQAEDMLTSALKDKDFDVRLTAAAAAGATNDHALIPALRIAMEDQAPEVVVTAAASLWKMGDHTGIDVLQEVLTGQMRSKSSLFKSGMHTMNKDIHDPTALATIGLEEGGGMLFGPVGIAIAAAKVMHPGPTANSARVIAANLLANDPSEANKTALIQTLKDKDPYVRQASAQALAKFQGKQVTEALIDGFDDPKPSVRFMAAASYIRVVSPIKTETPEQKPARKTPRKKTTAAKPS
jgi:HEAT repeat protein